MKLTKDDCIRLLQDKYKETGIYPRKAEFSEQEVSMIKAYFGPWPRALEAAGVKEPKEENRADRKRQKRIETKRARNAKRKELKKNKVAEKKGKVEE